MPRDNLARGIALQRSYAPPYYSGRYYTPHGMGTLTNGSASAVGTICWVPALLVAPVTLASLLVTITTLAAAGNFQVALYASSPTTGDPTGAPLYHSASQSTAATGVVEITGVNLALQPGVYWLAIQRDNATAAFLMPAQANSDAFATIAGQTANGSVLNAASNQTTTYFKAGTFGTFPTLTGNFTTDGLAVAAGSAAAWAFKAA